VVLGGEPGFAEKTAAYLRQIGWDVCTAATSEDLYAYAARKNPYAILLPVQNREESGYLTCAKLRLTRPKLKVVLVGEPTECARNFAGFVGADLASEANAVDAVMKLV
jgi:DNA-binding response OmpR family regulator